jgi:ATP synthase mitochondrial F1 complex assembly factor 2
MERATHAAKSFVIGLALVKKHITVEEAALAARVEVASQIERWGEVEDSGWSNPRVLLVSDIFWCSS